MIELTLLLLLLTLIWFEKDQSSKHLSVFLFVSCRRFLSSFTDVIRVITSDELTKIFDVIDNDKLDRKDNHDMSCDLNTSVHVSKSQVDCSQLESTNLSVKIFLRSTDDAARDRTWTLDDDKSEALIVSSVNDSIFIEIENSQRSAIEFRAEQSIDESRLIEGTICRVCCINLRGSAIDQISKSSRLQSTWSSSLMNWESAWRHSHASKSDSFFVFNSRSFDQNRSFETDASRANLRVLITFGIERLERKREYRIINENERWDDMNDKWKKE